MIFPPLEPLVLNVRFDIRVTMTHDRMAQVVQAQEKSVCTLTAQTSLGGTHTSDEHD